MKKIAKVLIFTMLITMVSGIGFNDVLVNAASPLVYEGFDYAPGAFVNNAGGTGWSGGWNYSTTPVYRQGGIVSSNDPLIYTDGTKYLNTSGRDVAITWSYVNAARLLDMSATGALKDYITAANGYVGKTGTTIWGSYLTNFPNFASNDTRYVSLTNSATSIANPADSNKKVEIGTFGGPSQYLATSTTTAATYWTLRFYVGAGNPGNKNMSVTASDPYYYDSVKNFLYYRTSIPITGTAATNYLIAYSISYTATDSIINLYINPALAATEPVTPVATLTLAKTADDMNFKSFYMTGPGNINRPFYDEIRIGASFADVTPTLDTLPQPSTLPVLGTKIQLSPAPTAVINAYSTSGGQYLIDGITTSYTNVANNNNIGINAYYEISLATAQPVAGAKLWTGDQNTDKNPAAYYFAYYTGSDWETVPGSEVFGNRMTTRTIQFTKPVFTNKIRLCNVSSTNSYFRELELYAPATSASYDQTYYSVGSTSWSDDFSTAIDSDTNWTLVGATPAGGAATPPVVSTSPYPTPFIAPQIVDDSAGSPLNWGIGSLKTPPPAASAEPNFYAADGKALYLPIATNPYAYRSTNVNPSDYMFEFMFKVGQPASGNATMNVYFNESNTTISGATMAGTNAYQLRIDYGPAQNLFIIALNKITKASTTPLTSSYFNIRPVGLVCCDF